MHYYRLCYISQATKPDHLIRQDLMDIITEAVIFNAQNNIYGVLYYGNGYFFQCLEGYKTEIENLYYTRILRDKRHQNAVLLMAKEIKSLKFSSWYMKFAPSNYQIMNFMHTYNKNQFDPYVLCHDNLNEFLNLLMYT